MPQRRHAATVLRRGTGCPYRFHRGGWILLFDRSRESIEAGPVDSSQEFSPERREGPMSHKRHHPPPPEVDRELRRTVIAAAVQGLVREALVVIFGDVWRGGRW
jgi:hypothetical protein